MAKLEVQYGEDKKVFEDGVAHLETEGNMMRADLNLIATGGFILDGPYDSFEDLPEVGDPEHIYYVYREGEPITANLFDEYLYLESSEGFVNVEELYNSKNEGIDYYDYYVEDWTAWETSEGWDPNAGGDPDELIQN